MNLIKAIILAAALGLAAAHPAAGQSIDYMLGECSGLAQQFHRDYEARTDMKYQGKRTDGTHAVGGDIYLETRSAYVSCSFAPDRLTMTEFYVDGKDQTAFFRGGSTGGTVSGLEQDAIDACIGRVRRETGGRGGEVLRSSYSEAGTLVVLRDAANTVWECIAYRDGTVGELRVAERGNSGGGQSSNGEFFRVTGVSANDVLNVRRRPSAQSAIVGALSNGTRVRNLGCRSEGNSRWCRIRMLDDMGSEGWVNARYLTSAAAAQRPRPPAADAGGTRTVRVRFPAGTTGTELTDRVAPGGSVRYVINARNRQFLYARVAAGARGLSYQIFNPDRSFLLDQTPAAREYRGQLWQSGNHVIEVINRGNRSESFNLIVGLE